ncbi:MAG TPA: 6-hydroxymethylpterin diphosphokinase MptE-like protein [Spirochaetia bacterium]|nr:6-hydroxymethylpterin diphosphokinase MptE-like protein [Spirochaetia bacterium]
MLEVFASRAGPPSLKIDGRAYHSAFDPVREAERYLETALGAGDASTVVVLGEGLGYISRAVRDRLPAARVISIQYSRDLPAPPAERADTWRPGAEEVSDFLRARLGELDVEGLRVIEWPPGARIFPEESRRVQTSLQQVLRELTGSFVTTVAAGKLWLRNCIANFLAMDSALQGDLCSRTRPIIIAAPGPSLETAAPLLLELRAKADLWALPSSAPFLKAAGLTPDLLVITDPGYYAVTHLQFDAPQCPVAMPLSAARGLWRLRRPGVTSPGGTFGPLLLSQPGLIEETFLKQAGLQAPRIAPHGTVSATALNLALASTTGPVIFAGLDMCTRDLSSHARPNAFELFLLLKATRVEPFHGLSYRRNADQDALPPEGNRAVRASRALRTYAGWFATASADGRAYRLFPSAVDLPRLAGLDEKGVRRMLSECTPSDPGNHLTPDPRFPSREKRRRIVAGILDGWVGIISAGLEAARGAEGFTALGRRPSLLELAYSLEARLLLETKRKARLGDASSARDSAVILLETCKGFLETVGAKALHAA